MFNVSLACGPRVSVLVCSVFSALKQDCLLNSLHLIFPVYSLSHRKAQLMYDNMGEEVLHNLMMSLSARPVFFLTKLV